MKLSRYKLIESTGLKESDKPFQKLANGVTKQAVSYRIKNTNVQISGRKDLARATAGQMEDINM